MSAVTAKNGLLTPAELSFFNVLRKIAGKKFTIAIKVRVADLIECSPAAWKAYGQKTAGQHVDFVLLAPKDLRIVACIELDDRSHRTERAYQKDKVKTEILYEAGIPLVRVPVRREYDKKELKKQIKDTLKRTENGM